MGYEKVKTITRKPKENKIFITSASNNVRPITYSKWEFMVNETDYHTKELELMLGINGGGLFLNDSCYDYLYAYYKAKEELGKDYDLYDLTRYNYPIYFIGEKILEDERYFEITKNDLTEDFVLDYDSKSRNYKEYYKKDEKIEDENRRTEVLEKYYQVFEKYFNEKHNGKYLINSDRGFVIKKKSSIYFCTDFYSSPRYGVEGKDYKEQYCKVQDILRSYNSKDWNVRIEQI